MSAMRSVNIVIRSYNPEPWTVGTVGIGRKNNKPYGRISKDGRLLNYQNGVAEDIKTAYPNLEPFPKTTPLQVEFYFFRHLEQYTTQSGRNMTRHRCDVTNASKALEDALQGVLFHNDIDNVATLPVMVNQAKNIEPLILIHARPWTESSPVRMSNWKQIINRAPTDKPIWVEERDAHQ